MPAFLFSGENKLTTKTEYLESQRGKTYTEIVADQPVDGMIGSIRGENLRDVVAILAGGLQYRLENAAPSIYKTALQTAFRYMTLPDYAINLALPENAALLSGAVDLGLVTPAESNKFYELATYTRLLHNITRQDCVDYFGPAWAELEETEAHTLVVRLLQSMPEQSCIVVEIQDIYEDGTLSNWYYATALHGLTIPKEYTVRLPSNGYPRRLRWKCEYPLSGTVSTR